MYKIDNETASTTIPTPAAVGVNPDSFFTNGDPNNSVPATVMEADWCNAVQEEICNVITAAGTTLSKTTRTQMRDAILLLSQSGTSKYTASTTAANTYTATLTPAPAAYITGMIVFVKFTNHNTGAATINLNSLGAKSIVKLDGSALGASDIADGMIATLGYDGTNFQLLSGGGATTTQVQTGTLIYAASTTAANTYTATLSPVPASYTTGMVVYIKFTNANTGAATINLNSLGAKSIVSKSGDALIAGQIAAGMIAELGYDGTNFQLMNAYVTKAVQDNSFCYTASTTAANTYTATLTPAPSAYTTGMRVDVKFTNKNTGAATINFNSLGAISIKRGDGSALVANNIADGMIATLIYDGTNFQLSNKYNDLNTDSSGRSTLPNQTMFVATTAAHTNVTGNNTTYTCIFETAATNVGSCYNTSTGIFTAPVTGTYLFAITMHLTGLGAANTLMWCNVNGGSQPYLFYENHITGMEPANGLVRSGSVLMKLTAGATCKIDILVNGGTQVVGLGGSANFSGILLA